MAELPQDALDAITGQPPQQAVVTTPEPTLSSAPAELFSINRLDAVGDFGDGTVGPGNEPIVAGIDQGSAGLGQADDLLPNVLGQGLSGLGQDQLQGLGGLMLVGLGDAV